MSPRRSSRARSSQIPPSAPTHANSSSSIPSSTKADRSTRSNMVGGNPNRPSPPGRASTAPSDSVDNVDSGSRRADSVLPPRRSRRGNESENSKEKELPRKEDEEEDPDEQAIEEDVTRCICGHAEYPGPGATVKDQLARGETLSDDVGNFFVQCDKCHVWQHGGCMGLTDESMLPDEYYCEQCKPDFHTIVKDYMGNKTSRYLPVIETRSRGSSPLSDPDAPRSGKNKNKLLESTKRRATMNSRGAYDEDEMLRRAIEESREMGTLGKRARDDNDDPKLGVKRRRTGSSVSSGKSARSQSPSAPTAEPMTRSATNGSKSAQKLRGAAAKNSREKELRDKMKEKEQVAAQRAEAASKRNARSERRRGEDSPPPTPGFSPSKSQAATTNTKADADTPPSNKAVNRKGGRPLVRRGRLGRNQYTRDLPANGETSDSPLRDTSRDPHGVDSPRPHTNGHGRETVNGESGRSSKAKTHPARTSMNEMKRRVAAILEFVGRMQTERGQVQTNKSSSDGGGGSRSSGASSLKGNSTPNGTTSSLPTASLVKAVTEGLEVANESKKQQQTIDGKVEVTRAEPSTTLNGIIKSEKDFDEMNSSEMMDILTKELVTWQQLYGVYPR